MPRRHTWTDAEVAYVKQHFPCSTTRAIAEHLGLSHSQVSRKAYELGLKKTSEHMNSVNSGRFRKGMRPSGTTFRPGHTPWNKGKKGFHPGGRSVETRFKAGHLPQTWKPIGSERLSKDGYLQRKITDTRNPKRDRQFVHHLIWRQHHGDIPPGHCVIFANGDKTDLRIENLRLITRAENMRRNGISNMPEELAQVCRLRGVLNRHINRMSRNEEQD